ncbi:MAG: NAD(P)/FAD-dependent oxidoreductase [Acidimicrobiales bacterium]
MTDWRTRSYWMSRNDYTPGPRLDGNTSCDVVIMGAGFTGLWTAIQLKEADPALDVVVLEGEVAGYGASGRNGGFAMTMVSRNIHDLLRKCGHERARNTHLAMRDSLHEIEEFCAKHEIDADVTNPGLLTLSNGPEQDIRIEQDLIAAEKLGLDDFKALTTEEVREIVHSDKVRIGHLEDDALLVDPAALSRGLRDAAVSLGVNVFERTPVESMTEVEGGAVVATTPFGNVVAERGVIATNAYAQSFPELRRYLFTIYANIIVTDPLTDEQWDRVGWTPKVGIEDKRVMPHFHRPTPDRRILWGGRDAPFSPVGPNPRWDRNPWIASRLEETFRWTFPQLSDVKIASAWAGPVCGTINCFATIGWLGGTGRIAYAVGYAGHGVGPSHLAAKILKDMLLGRDSELLTLPMVTKKPTALPPGPTRRFFLDSTQRLLQKGDDIGTDAGPLLKLTLKALQ